jgi:hypothetical protein
MALFLEDPGPKHVEWTTTPISYWSGSDNKQTYHGHLKNPGHRELLEKYDWIDTQIEYNANRQSFRADEFDNRPCGVALGCSFTRGIGLHNHQVWPSVLSTLSGLHFWNLGVGGGAMDTCTRLLDYYIGKLKPQIVVLFEPPKRRFEYHEDGFWHVMGLNSPPFQDFQKVYYAYDENSIVNHRRNMLSMQQICAQNNVPFYSWACTDNRVFPPIERSDLARDLLHQGPLAQRQLAEAMYQKIAPEITRL